MNHKQAVEFFAEDDLFCDHCNLEKPFIVCLSGRKEVGNPEVWLCSDCLCVVTEDLAKFITAKKSRLRPKVRYLRFL